MEENISKRACRKCGKAIPYTIKIDGKTHNLGNRKFCMECSPFMGRNTSPNDPIERKPREWGKYSEKQKDAVKMCLYKRGLERRRELYKIKGGKCQICGYNKCERALSFHHRDPSQKLFGLSLNNLWSKEMSILIEELNKCDLLCMNCHAELEDSIARDTSIVARINAKYGTDY